MRKGRNDRLGDASSLMCQQWHHLRSYFSGCSGCSGLPVQLSAQAVNFVIVRSGYAWRTYISTPSSLLSVSSTGPFNVQVIAVNIALLDDYPLSRGKKVLDFLKAWLYGGLLAGLDGITSCLNPGCRTDEPSLRDCELGSCTRCQTCIASLTKFWPCEPWDTLI
jgi:hypothetical protein